MGKSFLSYFSQKAPTPNRKEIIELERARNATREALAQQKSDILKRGVVAKADELQRLIEEITEERRSRNV